MSEAADKQYTEDDLAGMSDEEIMNLDMSFLDQDTSEQEPPETEASAEPEQEEHEEQEDGKSEEPAVADATSDDEDDAAESEDAADDDATDEPVADTDKDTADEPEGDKAGDGEEGKAEDDAASIDYEAEYKKVFAPFKANGKDITPRSAEDIVQLMQMGANYNKKMAGLKPNLKLVKMLENNELLDESKLSYLIDLSKKDPEAIKKLVKDSGIDPLDFDNEKDSEYKPKTYTVDDRQIELDQVLDEIQDTPTYSKTVNLVSNKWDKQSKEAVADKPQLLKALNDQIAAGIYDRINAEVEQERTFGRLSGLSDIEAYQKVGDAMHARGGFEDLMPKTAHQDTPAPERKKVITPEAKAEDPARKDKKRAAGSTRKAVTAKVDTDFNPLSMSDEAFEKLINEKLM